MKGHIRERSPGHWAIVIEQKDPATGKRRRKWHSFRGGRREAQKECTRLLSEIDRGEYIDPNKTTVAEFLEQWLADRKARVGAKTYERYEQMCRKNIVPLVGGTALTKLKPEQISKAYADALASGRRDGKGGLSPRTVHHMHVVLKGALKRAVRWRKIARNPLDDVDPPKVERREMKVYNIGQTAELIETARGEQALIPVLLASLCGLRRGEVAALRWRNVDLAGACLSLTHSAEQTKDGVRYKAPKSGKPRTVALPASVVEELRMHRLAQAETWLKFGRRLGDDDFVVAQADGSPVRPHSVGQNWVRFLKRHSRLPRIRFHDLRHTHATHLLASGVHPKIASERLGHSKVSITLDTYSHVLPNMQADAAALVDGAVAEAIKKRSESVR